MSHRTNKRISRLLEKVWTYIVSLKRADKTTYMYKCYGIRPVQSYFSEHSITVYSEKDGNDCIAYYLHLFQERAINQTKLRTIRKVIVMMTSIMNNGTYVWTYEPSIHAALLSPKLQKIMDDYSKYLESRNCSPTTLRGLKPVIKHFLSYVSNLGFDNLKKLKISDVNRYIPALSNSYKNVGACLSILRAFGHYLSDEGICSVDLESLLTVKVPFRKKIYTGFSQNEISDILSAPDTTTSLGKRDYAIMMLATHTGLRGIDVLTLKYSDIDWKQKEIHLIQSKTSKPIILPVSVNVLNAIARYILEARPVNNSTDIIFLRSRMPHDPLRTWSAHSIIKRNAKTANIEWSPSERKGFHTMRRTLASRMLSTNVPLDTIKEVLGHSSTDSTRPYLGAELSKLGECPLSLELIPLRREELK